MIATECLTCLRRLIEAAVEAACDSPELRRQAVDRCWSLVEDMKELPVWPSYLANRFHPVIKDLCGNPDPFAAHKRQEMAAAGVVAERFAPGPDAPLRELIGFSAQGNALDFFRAPDELVRWLEQPPRFAIDHVEELEARLAVGPRALLWLADNAGEVFFDRPVLERLARNGHRVTYVVKGGAVQNDLTLEDFRSVMSDGFPVPVADTGAATVGLELDRVAPRFRQLYRAADLVVAKGMGHFETLGQQSDPRVFLIFMAKCAPVARSLGVQVDDFVAYFVAREGACNSSGLCSRKTANPGR